MTETDRFNEEKKVIVSVVLDYLPFRLENSKTFRARFKGVNFNRNQISQVWL